ncbi:MAG: glycosyl hydrolase 53 family protein [Gracilimonas sp.]|nr:glycosyl hydrolase 53 family protein [Gracilimonas sp.]
MLSSCDSPSGSNNDDPPVSNDIEFIMGADLSYVNQILDHGGEYKSEGVVKNPYQIFTEKGTDAARFRLFNNPSWIREVYGQESQLYHDIEDVKLGIQRAKENGMNILLDYHYSDIWADPGAQEVPKAWEGKVFEAVQDSLYRYTFNTLKYLSEHGALPEMVQIGNENNCGLIHPYANVCNSDEWEELGKLLNSGIQAVRDIEDETSAEIKVMLHVAQPENVTNWFNNVIEEGQVTDFDVVGFSYYTQWSDIPLSRISAFVENFRLMYEREVMILETAYPWTVENADNYGNIFGNESLINGYPATKEGQKQFMIDLVQEVKDGGGNGVFYWEPAWITSNLKDLWGTGSSWENNALFDFEGNAHIGFDYMTHEYETEE